MLIKADAKDAIEKLIEFVTHADIKDFSKWLEQCNLWKEKYKVCLPEYKNVKGAINSYLFIDQLCKQSSENDIFDIKYRIKARENATQGEHQRVVIVITTDLGRIENRTVEFEVNSSTKVR